jgi:dextranase
MRLIQRLIPLVFVIFLQGGAVFAVDTTVQLMPDKSFYYPGDSVQITVSASEGTRVEAYITFLAQLVATLNAPLVNSQASLTWTPPLDAPRGYGLTFNVLDANGTLLASQSTAFDVLNHWIEAPRYGFLSDFSPARLTDASTLEWMLRHHINGVQFYDWQYRWEDLLPETDRFDDGLGRSQSMTTIRRLIDVLHSGNIAAMPYTAIYGASFAFYRQHPDWAIFDARGEAYTFGDNLIGIMDPTPGSAWNTHLLAEFADVLDHTTFDGIHIDQYGSPKMGFDNQGNPVDLAEVMPAFINQTAELVQERRGDSGVTLFNSVGNWPIEAVAPSQQDASYIEVWPPYNDYLDLNRIITNAQHWGSEKPVILAAYIPPERTINWRLANSVILASGAYHLETGEPGTMLQDPYFPRFGHLADEQEPQFTRYYDFLVRYENVLSVGTVAAESVRHNAISLGDVRIRGIRSRDRVVPIVRSGANFETFSLINFLDIDASDWNAPTNVAPTPLTDQLVTVAVDRPVVTVWYASPDDPSRMNAAALPFTVEENTVSFTLPRLDYWSMIVVEYEHDR